MKAQGEYNKLKQSLKTEIDLFSVSLNKDHFNKALNSYLASKSKFEEAGLEMPSLGVHTSEVYKAGFTFPQISLNDYAVEQINLLKEAEAKLNASPENSDILDSFIDVSNKVSQALTERYNRQWINPRGESVVVPQKQRSSIKIGGSLISVNYDEEPYDVDLHSVNEVEGLEKIETIGTVFE